MKTKCPKCEHEFDIEIKESVTRDIEIIEKRFKKLEDENKQLTDEIAKLRTEKQVEIDKNKGNKPEKSKGFFGNW